MSVKKQTPKYKIVIEIPFKTASTSDATMLKRAIKARTPKIVFTSLVKAGKNYGFKGRLSYVKAIAASASDVKRVISAQTPGAVVRVTKA